MRRGFVMFLLALLLAGGAAFLANQWVKSLSESTRSAGIATEPVVVAAIKIPFGRKLEATDVKVTQWPEGNVPDDTFQDPAQLIGMVTKREFVKDELIVKDRVTEHLGGSTLSALIAEGKRAISVRVNDVVGVAGFVLPGNMVDVLATRQTGPRDAKTRTLLQNMRVLAVDQEASPEKDQPAVVRAVTLEMSPEQAETLVQARQEGSLQLTLRNPLDDHPIQRAKAVEEPPPPTVVAAPKPQPARPLRTRIVRRADRSIGILNWGQSAATLCKDKTC